MNAIQYIGNQAVMSATYDLRYFHIALQTKHLYKSLWRPSQLFMVQYLALAGANRFWEHVLLEPLLTKRNDPSKSPSVVDKKPQPDSPLHPTKADFIRKKYLFHGFFKMPNVIHPDDLNQQLHASVRTAVLETSLYLLALVNRTLLNIYKMKYFPITSIFQGADPNYIHPVKGTSPVHVACQYEQVGQLELLIAYGGNVCLRSGKGITPLEVFFQLFSLTFFSLNFVSLFSFYLCRTKVDFMHIRVFVEAQCMFGYEPIWILITILKDCVQYLVVAHYCQYFDFVSKIKIGFRPFQVYHILTAFIDMSANTWRTAFVGR